ncbi:hypothetical protein HY029_01640 [Candidatus Gottesmanbacteria bacterium]|nr:hypothetical protein [Candidatus Gottesmanbacteria bacterium]
MQSAKEALVTGRSNQMTEFRVAPDFILPPNHFQTLHFLETTPQESRTPNVTLFRHTEPARQSVGIHDVYERMDLLEMQKEVWRQLHHYGRRKDNIATPIPVKENTHPKTKASPVEIFSRAKLSIANMVDRAGYGLLEMQRTPGLFEQTLVDKALQLLNDSSRGIIHAADMIRPRRKYPLVLASAVVLALAIVACGPTPPNNGTPQTSVSQSDCAYIPPNQQYGKLLDIGSHGGSAISKKDYVATRKNINCANPGDDVVKEIYSPRTIIYDKSFLLGNVSSIRENLLDLKASGQYPIIRVATSYTDTQDWEQFNADDAEKMGENLARALQDIQGFPIRPIIVFGNEPNLNHEWKGGADPKAFAQSLFSFMMGLDKASGPNYRNFQVFFPALSHSIDGQNGIKPDVFIKITFQELDRLIKSSSNKFAGGPQARNFDGIAINLWEKDMNGMNDSLTTQAILFRLYAKYFNYAIREVITEYGAVAGGRAFDNCSDAETWERLNNPLIKAYLRGGLKSAHNLLALTIGCFEDGRVVPGIIRFADSEASLAGN